MDYLTEGLYYIFGLIKVGEETKENMLCRVLIALNIVGNMILIVIGSFIMSTSGLSKLTFALSVFISTYISLFIFKSSIYLLVYVFFGKKVNIWHTIKKSLIFNTIAILTTIGLMFYFSKNIDYVPESAVPIRMTRQEYQEKYGNVDSFVPDNFYKNDGSISLKNENVNKDGLSSRYTASIINNASVSLNNVVVRLTILEPSSKNCDDQIIDTISFEILKFDDDRTLSSNSTRIIQYDFGYSERNYPDGWLYCGSVLGGYITQ